ncbi:MAG: SsgA family sporulation/cell division regulator [Actinomycetia bacterium]|nr:SsgA family sporulation/cell division regulator [Actinomycetes bacterium]
MGTHPEGIEEMVPAWFGETTNGSVLAMFSYEPSDPFAVTARFTTGDLEVSWTFGRELLREGLLGTSGLGDVRFSHRNRREINLDLVSPDGSARIVCDATALNRFLARSYALLPAGQECDYLDLDSWLTRLTI